jgi:prephenate dehydratase
MDPADRIAHLGPLGTFSEAAALFFQSQLQTSPSLMACPSIEATLEAVADGDALWGVVPVENAVEGGVSITLDTFWILEGLYIHQALILPIRYALISCAKTLSEIEIVYSHPQALGQCRNWIRQNLPGATQVATRSTTEGLNQVQDQAQVAVIAPERAVALYHLPVLACPTNDHPWNVTRFWVVTRDPKLSQTGSHTSLAFSLPENKPGALLKPLQIFAERQLNMSRIESRPTKKVAGTYVFFIDLENGEQDHLSVEVIQQLEQMTDRLKVFGSYCTTKDYPSETLEMQAVTP